jgi:predicted glycosyltransferase
MNVLVNISHPAHVHLFKNAIGIMRQNGHNVIVGARKKEFTIELLKAYNIRHVVLTKKGRGPFGLIKELIEQQIKLSKIIKTNSIDIMLQMNGIFNAPIGRFYQIPTLAFSDTENDKWANRFSFSLSKHVFSPSCFNHRIGGSWKNQIHYPGYHELAYLSPRHVSDEIIPENKFLLRFVGWEAGHDIGEKGLPAKQKTELVDILKELGSVHISSEAPLPKEIASFAHKLHPSEIHNFMMKCKMVIGESATMASEAACLGIPAVFISNTGRGYTTEQDKKYGLIKHYRLNQWKEIVDRLKRWGSRDMTDEWQKKRCDMLKDKIDVTSWLVDLVQNYPTSILDSQQGDFERYSIKCAG